MKVLSIFGTRPEAVKMAPVVLALNAHPDFVSRVCVTGQHRQMLDPVLALFEIEPHHDLNIMTPGQDLFDMTSRVLLGLRYVIRAEKPDMVLVQGDTTSCFAAALAAFYEGVVIGHVEAGLRTSNLRLPFPEEAYRAMVSRIADYHFAPTQSSNQNLLREGIAPEKIWVTGNTVIDALIWVRNRIARYSPTTWQSLFGNELYSRIVDRERKLILVTAHRRESFGLPFHNMCRAISELAQSHMDWDFVYPVHLNPHVQHSVDELLAGLGNVHLIKPLDYAPFVWLMDQSTLVLTDSGGVQEEAPSMGKPVVVMREVTERAEAMAAGTVRLVGTQKIAIKTAVEALLGEQHVYASMAKRHNPYGEGKAALRIVEVLAVASLHRRAI